MPSATAGGASRLSLGTRAGVSRSPLLIGSALVMASATWSVVHRAELLDLRTEVDRVVLIGVGISLAALCSAVSVCVFALVAAPIVRRGQSPPSDGHAAGFAGRARSRVSSVLAEAPQSGWFLVAWILNSIGGLAPSLLVAVGIVWLLPPGSWGLAWIPAMDFVLSLVGRAAIHGRIRRSRRSPAAL